MWSLVNTTVLVLLMIAGWIFGGGEYLLTTEEIVNIRNNISSTIDLSANSVDITPNGNDIILFQNQPKIITCSDSDPVIWVVPFNTRILQTHTQLNDLAPERTTIRFNYTQQSDSPIVGYYYCLARKLYEDLDSPTQILDDTFLLVGINNTRIKRIYLFLANSSSKFAAPNDVVTSLGKTVWLPCRPTSNNTDNVILSDGIFSQKRSIDLYRGIEYNVTEPNHFTYYTCRTLDYEDNLFYDYSVSFEIKRGSKPTKPVIRADNYGYAIDKGNLTLNCTSDGDEGELTYVWKCPPSTSQNCTTKKKTLHLTNLQSNTDSGPYGCIVRNTQLGPDFESSTIFQVNIIKESIITFLANTNRSTTLKEEITELSVRFFSYPRPKTVDWYFSNGTKLHNTQLIEIYPSDDFSSYRHVLKFYKTQLEDAGSYTLKVEHEFGSKEHIVAMIVNASPSVTMKANVNVKLGKFAEVECNVVAFPKPTVVWYFTPSPKFTRNSSRTPLNETIIHVNTVVFHPYKFIYELEFFQPLNPGILECVATNEVARQLGSSSITVTEKGKDLALDSPGNQTIECFATIAGYRNNFTWFRNGKELEIRSGMFKEQKTLKFMYKSVITFSDFRESDSGNYSCMVSRIDSGSLEEISPPYLIQFDKKVCLSLKGQSISILQISRTTIVLQCEAKGAPEPSISWLKDYETFAEDRRRHTKGTSLSIDILDEMTDVGLYTCRVTNFFETKSIEYKLIKPVKPNLHIYLTLGLTIILLVAFIFFRWRKPHSHKQLLASFKYGNGKTLNPLLCVNDQADTLPYDKKYDFDENSLKLGMHLGSGQFYDILMAEAIGMVPGEKRTSVTVKRIKNPNNRHALQGLIDELKIMVYMGAEHNNILKLLGAVRVGLEKGELLVIREYCEHGNLDTYIRRNRFYFVDQIDNSNEINPDILSVPDPYGRCRFSVLTLNQILQDKIDVPSFTTTDLVCWSYQVALGMKYLASKGVLHGDLSARNILLTKSGFVRIFNFEIFPNVCKDTQTNSKNRPEWRAIEKLYTNQLSIDYDIWSYGIMMWELFTLGEVPYYNIDMNLLMRWLENGNRLECPNFATEKIHQIMLKCWFAEVNARLLFDSLVEELSYILNDELLMVSYNITNNNTSTPDRSQKLADEMTYPRKLTRNKNIHYLATSEMPISDVSSRENIYIEMECKRIGDDENAFPSSSPSVKLRKKINEKRIQ